MTTLLPEELERHLRFLKHHQELEVTALWGDHILDVSNYATPTIVTWEKAPGMNT